MSETQNQEDLDLNRTADILGVVLSGLCAVHCLLTPFFLGLIPALDHALGETTVHALMAPVLVLIAALAFFRGYRLHHHASILALGGSGLALMLIALVLTPSHHSSGLNAGTLLTLMGSVLLIVAHIQNMRFCRDRCCR